MKKQLLSILTATAMTLSAIPFTVNAAELDDYVNSSNKELAEFFEGFAVNSEYQRDDGAVLTTDGNKIISLYNSDIMKLDIYPTLSDNIYEILNKCQTSFESTNINASYITDECLSLNLVNVPREKVEDVCDEITAEFEIERINLRTTDYRGSKYTGSYRKDGFQGGLYKDIDLISDEVLFIKEDIKYLPHLSCTTRNRSEALAVYVPKTTTTAPPKTTVSSTTKAEETEVKFDVDIQFFVDAYTNDYLPQDTDFNGKIKFFEKDTVSENPNYFPVLKAMTPVAEYSFTAKNGKCTVENIELQKNCEVVIWVDELPEGYCSRYGTNEIIYGEGGTSYYANKHKTISVPVYKTSPVIPCDDDFDIGFKLTNSKGDIIENVDCTIYEYSRADENSPYIRQTVAEFNTSDYPEGYNGKMHIKLDKENDYTDNYITVALDNVPEQFQQSYNKMKDNQYISFSESILIQGIYIWDLIHNKIKQEGNAVEFDPYYTNEYDYNNYYNPFDIKLTLFSEEDYTTMTTTVTLSTIATTTTVSGPINTGIADTNKVNGDANCDGNVNMADAVLIMQSLANPDKYGADGTDETHITEQGVKNADIDGNGLTNADALKIQKKILKIEDDFDNIITTDFIVTEIEENTILVKPTDSNTIYRVSKSVIADGSTPKVNSIYAVTWNGETLETYPAQFGKIYDMRLVK